MINYILSKLKDYYFNKQVQKEGEQFFSKTLRASHQSLNVEKVGFGPYVGFFSVKNILLAMKLEITIL